MIRKHKTLVIILNWNNSIQTLKCIEEFKIVEENYIMVIDNGSDEVQRTKLIEYFTYTDGMIIQQGEEESLNSKDNLDVDILYLLDENYGYAKGNNFGLKLSNMIGYEYSLICNNDILLSTSIIKELEIGLQKNSLAAVIGPTVLDTQGNIQGPFLREDMIHLVFKNVLFPISYLLNSLNKQKKKEKYYSENHKGEFEVYRLMGCCMLLKNELIEKINYFDENTFLYAEEMILSERLKSLGLITLFTNKVAVMHMHGLSTSTLCKGIKHKILINSLLYYYKTYRKYNGFNLSIIKMSFNIKYFIWDPVVRFVKFVLRIKALLVR